MHYSSRKVKLPYNGVQKIRLLFQPDVPSWFRPDFTAIPLPVLQPSYAQCYLKKRSHSSPQLHYGKATIQAPLLVEMKRVSAHPIADDSPEIDTLLDEASSQKFDPLDLITPQSHEAIHLGYLENHPSDLPMHPHTAPPHIQPPPALRVPLYPR